jgi:hypothetical protein
MAINTVQTGLAHRPHRHSIVTRVFTLCRALIALSLMTVSAHAQRSDWTVTWFEGSSGVPHAMTNCRVISVTIDTLFVESAGQQQALRLFNVHEISRLDTTSTLARPILVGAAIGAASGLVASAAVEKSQSDPNSGNPSTLAVAGIFAGIGAGIGLMKGIDSRTIELKLGELTSPEKVVAIRELMADEWQTKTPE